jgi:hypothetical protein
VIQGYRVVRSIGEGGFGAVYELVHCQFGRRAALKVLALPGARPEITARFLNEARAANAVHHPGIVQIFELGQLKSGAPWLMMEFIDGETLEERMQSVQRGSAPLRHDPVTILYQLADVLCVLHDRGVIHRDLKPANIKLMPDPSRPEGELTKLLDFGIAKFVSESLLEPKDEGPAPPHTRAGVIMGTPSYMAPEQCVSAATVTAAADVYAMGAIAYELLSGHKPFVADPPAIYTLKLTQDPPPLDKSGLPFELQSLVMAMLHRDAMQRPRMSQVAEILAKLGGRGASGAQVLALRSSSGQQPMETPRRLTRQVPLLLGTAFLGGGLSALVLFLARPSAIRSPAHDLGPRQPAVVDQATAIGDERVALPESPDLADPGVPDAATPPLDLATPPPQKDLGIGVPPGGATCTPQPVRSGCIRGAGLSEQARTVLASAAESTGLRLCPNQTLILERPLRGFLTCRQRPASLSQRLCDQFVLRADAQWKTEWMVPDRVEVKCSSH